MFKKFKKTKIKFKGCPALQFYFDDKDTFTFLMTTYSDILKRETIESYDNKNHLLAICHFSKANILALKKGFENFIISSFYKNDKRFLLKVEKNWYFYVSFLEETNSYIFIAEYITNERKLKKTISVKVPVKIFNDNVLAYFEKCQIKTPPIKKFFTNFYLLRDNSDVLEENYINFVMFNNNLCGILDNKIYYIKDIYLENDSPLKKEGTYSYVITMFKNDKGESISKKGIVISNIKNLHDFILALNKVANEKMKISSLIINFESLDFKFLKETFNVEEETNSLIV